MGRQNKSRHQRSKEKIASYEKQLKQLTIKHKLELLEAKNNYKKDLKEKFKKEKTVTVEKYEEMVQKNKLLNEELSNVKRKNKK